MATLVEQLYSQNHWTGIDGVQTVWDFTFSGGYILKSHVKAYYLNSLGVRVDVTVTEEMLTGEFQLTVVPAIPATATRFVIYRDTPKDLPLVNFEDGARVTEANLDRAAKQAVFVAAEVLDGASVSGVSLDALEDRIELLEAAQGGDLSVFGYKSMHQNLYTGSSNVLTSDNGKAHYKTDATNVNVPNTLPTEFLAVIINDHATDLMTITFPSAEAILQGGDDPEGLDEWVLDPRQTLSIMKVASGRWYISGKVSAP